MSSGHCPLYEGVAEEDEQAKTHLRTNASFGPASVTPDIGVPLLIDDISINCVELATILGFS